jgi:hypothetical protein
MLFIVRTESVTLDTTGCAIKMVRRTPAIVPGSVGKTDYFCEGDPDAARTSGLPVVAVHDGWYADDAGGGVAVFGQGKFWEVRDTPFSVRESDAGVAETAAGAELVNVRGAIFGV